MKKILISVLLLAGITFGQSSGKWIIDHQFRTYTDSLQWSTSTADALIKDSVWILSFNWNPDYIKFMLKGNANSTVDSVGVKLGYEIYNETADTLQETIYGCQTSLKDSAWATVNVMINNSTGKDYTLYNLPAFPKLKLSLLNYREGVITRKVQITVQAWKND